MWWCRAGKERRTAKLSSQLFLPIANILALTASGRQSPSVCYLLKDHLNIYKHFFFLVFVQSLANLWKAGWAPVKREIRPLCLQNKWFSATALTGLPSAALPSLLWLPGVSAPAFVCLLCQLDQQQIWWGLVLFFFSLTRFFKVLLKPVAGTGWEWAATRKRGRWATSHHHLYQTHCKLNPQPKCGLDSSGKINVENRDHEVMWIKLGHTCLTMQVGY